MTSCTTSFLYFVCLLPAAACAHSAPAAPSATSFRGFECAGTDDEQAASFGAALQVATEVDYLDVLSHGGGHDQMVVVERGTPCSGATDKARCEAELDRRKKEWVDAHPDCDGCDGGIVVMTTHGDDVTQYTSPTELLELLGPIDSPADAWLLLMMRERFGPHGCNDPDNSAYREVLGGFELRRRAFTLTCRPIERVEIVERFNRDGSVDPVRRTVVEYERDGCYVR